jgi:hypothetical protein
MCVVVPCWPCGSAPDLSGCLVCLCPCVHQCPPAFLPLSLDLVCAAACLSVDAAACVWARCVCASVFLDRTAPIVCMEVECVRVWVCARPQPMLCEYSCTICVPSDRLRHSRSAWHWVLISPNRLIPDSGPFPYAQPWHGQVCVCVCAYDSAPWPLGHNFEQPLWHPMVITCLW